jgi:threonyl-tRNA synthetase
MPNSNTDITLIMPDGAKRVVASGTTGADVAKAISPSLLKRTVAMVLGGTLADLSDPITADATIKFITRTDAEALELIRHDAAHVCAEAVQELWPGTQVTIGPVIENGWFYDFAKADPFVPDDLPKIEKKMHEIIGRNAQFRKEVWSRDKAKTHFKAKGENYKVELVDAIPAGEDVKIYSQGQWLDLCRGPHMPSTGPIGKAFKIMRSSGSYWRGDSKNAQLQRIYGVAFADEAALAAHLKQIEEAEKRDHRKIGREMDLFHFQEEGPGVVFWHAKGWTTFQQMISYMRRRLAGDYQEVQGPQLLDNMFAVKSATAFMNPLDDTAEQKVFALKPMNCPGHVQIFKHGLKSYRDLPLRLAEFGCVHRYEPSGALHGLMRVRGFTQDDAHIFCTEEQLEDECLKINDLMMAVYEDFGFGEVVVKLATRPEKRVGSDAMWDHAENILKKVLIKMAAESGGRIKTGINEGEGTFYGPKFEYTLRDAIGREWQCGTTQVDFNLPERFGAFYIAADGEKKQPVMVHRAICGSLERFLGIVIENCSGHFPLWLAPVQVVVATIVSDADDYAKGLVAKLKKAGIRANIDLDNEKINAKVRNHSLAKVPVLLVVGRREAEEGKVSVRRLGSPDQTVMTFDEALAALRNEATPPDMVE